MTSEGTRVSVSKNAPAPPLLPRGWKKAAKYAPRLVVLAALAALGWYIVATLHAVLDRPKPPAVGEPRSAERRLLGLPEVLAADAGELSWSLTNATWESSTRNVTPQTLVAELDRWPAHHDDLGPPADWEEAVLSLAAALRAQVEHRGPWEVLDAQGRQWRGRVFARAVAGRRRVVSARLAAQDEQGEWVLFEVRPARATAAAAEKGSSELLPMPAGVERLAVRRDSAGRLRGEWLAAPLSPSDLVAHWQAHDCRVRPQLAPAQDSGMWLVEGGGTTLQVWTSRSCRGEAAMTYLMALRLTDP